MIININYEACRGIDCLDCLDICPMNVFDTVDDVLIIKKLDNCCGCQVCVDVCPNNAISIEY